jgi:cardiolipin synthase
MRTQEELDVLYLKEVANETEEILGRYSEEISHYVPLVHFLNGIGHERLSWNYFRLLINGEEKFPEVLKILEKAGNFIHMEYYDWENDVRGNQIKEVLLKKSKEGVRVRVLYDDYASRKIKRNIVRELKKGGVEIYPKIRVKIRQFASRVNHRDHRKVIIVDGTIGFVGGINISDRYDNTIDTGLYWRDTHLKITGPLVLSLQRHFIVSWNSCKAAENLSFSKDLFPEGPAGSEDGISGLGQVVAGGPIYPMSNIMLSYSRIFMLAKETLFITNPYFIPSESIRDALKQAAISGVDVRLMIPEKSDSAIVGAASRFYFSELLEAGVQIFLYKKGFIHAKTIVADTQLSVIGTANMDIRSFDLNFEIMSIIYGRHLAEKMEKVYKEDLKECKEVIIYDWNSIGIIPRLSYAIARLISSFL